MEPPDLPQEIKQREERKNGRKSHTSIEIESRPGISKRRTLREHRERAILFITFPSQHELTLLFEQLNASGISEFD